MMQLSQVSQAVNGQLIGKDVALIGVSIDTRVRNQDELFIALKGERFDAHDFIAQAENSGAGAVMVEREVDTALPKVLVADCHKALKDLATWWRAQFVIPVMGITGSVGKTTVKEMLGSIFAEIGQGVVTRGNLNNEIGLPLTLMRLSKDDRYAIVEMGMNRAGEIDRLTRIAKPTIALINNAAAAHLENLGSVEAVAHAKGEIFSGLTEDGVAIINADDRYVDLWRELIAAKRCLTFGFSKNADIRADYQTQQSGLKVAVTMAGKTFDVELATFGKHNVSNALAAIAVASAANIPVELIQSGLKNYRPIGGRLNVSSVADLTVIDDTYNANPASMLAAIEVLSDYEKRTLIVGDMAELGDAAEQAHCDVGLQAAKNGIDCVYACGEFAQIVISKFNGRSYAFETQAELISALTPQLVDELKGPRAAVLVKGSRSYRMEKVVTHLKEILAMPQTDKMSGGSRPC